jgi:hypothetical protein
MGKAFAAFAASYFVLVLIKDGTLPGLFQDAAKTAGDLAKGIKPISTVG